MKFVTLRKVALALTALVSVSVLTACTSSNVPYRTYYLDRACGSFYVDEYGNRVYAGKYRGKIDYVGLKKMQDANGRWYYEDAWGNRLYKTKRCGR